MCPNSLPCPPLNGKIRTFRRYQNDPVRKRKVPQGLSERGKLSNFRWLENSIIASVSVSSEARSEARVWSKSSLVDRRMFGSSNSLVNGDIRLSEIHGDDNHSCPGSIRDRYRDTNCAISNMELSDSKAASKGTFLTTQIEPDRISKASPETRSIPNSIIGVNRRHFPQLRLVAAGEANEFATWRATSRYFRHVFFEIPSRRMEVINEKRNKNKGDDFLKEEAFTSRKLSRYYLATEHQFGVCLRPSGPRQQQMGCSKLHSKLVVKAHRGPSLRYKPLRSRCLRRAPLGSSRGFLEIRANAPLAGASGHASHYDSAAISDQPASYKQASGDGLRSETSSRHSSRLKLILESRAKSEATLSPSRQASKLTGARSEWLKERQMVGCTIDSVEEGDIKEEEEAGAVFSSLNWIQSKPTSDSNHLPASHPPKHSRISWAIDRSSRQEKLNTDARFEHDAICIDRSDSTTQIGYSLALREASDNSASLEGSSSNKGNVGSNCKIENETNAVGKSSGLVYVSEYRKEQAKHRRDNCCEDHEIQIGNQTDSLYNSQYSRNHSVMIIRGTRASKNEGRRYLGKPAEESASKFCLASIFVMLIAIASSISGTEGVDCFKCSSRNGSNPACEDPFHNLNQTRVTQHTLPDPMPPLIYHAPCYAGRKGKMGLFPATACIKLTGVFDSTGETLVVRHCALDSGSLTQDTELARMSHCGRFQFEGDHLRGCVLACPHDACNGAPSSHQSLSWHLMTLASLGSLLILSIVGKLPFDRF